VTARSGSYLVFALEATSECYRLDTFVEANSPILAVVLLKQ